MTTPILPIGYLVNQDNVRFCTVYLSSLPDDIKWELSQHTDLWNQVRFAESLDKVESIVGHSATFIQA